MAGKGTLDSHDSDSSTGGSGGRRGTPTPRLPVDPPPQRPPFPWGNPPRAAKETDRDRDPLFTMSVKEESQGVGGSPWAPKGEPHKPPPCMTGPTELPGFNPRVPPPRLTHLVPIWRAPMKRERGRQTFREPDSYPEPPAETPEGRRAEAQRAQQEHGWVLDTQAWTTTERGLETEEDLSVPQTGWGMVSPIQCLACATYRIPALRFCYRCFNKVAVNHLIRATNLGGSHRYRCHMCFIETRTRAEMYRHCSQTHIPKEYVDFRYPFKEHEIAIITVEDEDRYNKDVDPRNSPLRPSILIPREVHPIDGSTPSDLEWYESARGGKIPGARTPISFSSPITTKRMKTDPVLDCRFCRKPGCFMICRSASMEVAMSAVKCSATRFQMQRSINQRQKYLASARISRLSGNFPGCLQTCRIFWRISRLSGNFQRCLEI